MEKYKHIPDKQQPWHQSFEELKYIVKALDTAEFKDIVLGNLRMAGRDGIKVYFAPPRIGNCLYR